MESSGALPRLELDVEVWSGVNGFERGLNLEEPLPVLFVSLPPPITLRTGLLRG